MHDQKQPKMLATPFSGKLTTTLSYLPTTEHFHNVDSLIVIIYKLWVFLQVTHYTVESEFIQKWAILVGFVWG